MTKGRVLDEVQSQDGDVNKRHYGEDVKFYRFIWGTALVWPQRFFKNLGGALNSKSTQMLSWYYFTKHANCVTRKNCSVIGSTHFSKTFFF